jgi:hypothetical protein
MSFCLFLVFKSADADARLGAAEIAEVDAAISGKPGVTAALRHTPASAHDPFLNDGPSPLLALQLYFDRIAEVERAAARDGWLQALADEKRFPTLAAAHGAHEAMAVRAFPVAEPPPPRKAGTPYCTNLVAYEGPAEDFNAWLDDYIAGHTPLMGRLPGIRELEVCSRVDWISFLPWERATHMQRNKVVFDRPEALSAAMQSPIRAEMRAHYKRLPPFSGGVTHFPMQTVRVA